MRQWDHTNDYHMVAVSPLRTQHLRVRAKIIRSHVERIIEKTNVKFGVKMCMSWNNISTSDT